MILKWLANQNNEYFFTQKMIDKMHETSYQTYAFNLAILKNTKNKMDKFKANIVIENQLFLINFLDLMELNQINNANALAMITKQISDFKNRIAKANQYLDDEVYIEPNAPELTDSNRKLLESTIQSHSAALEQMSKQASKLTKKLYA